MKKILSVLCAVLFLSIIVFSVTEMSNATGKGISAAYFQVHVAPVGCSGDRSGASVTVRDASNNLIYSGTTNSSGWVSWNAEGLAYGTYTVRATWGGYCDVDLKEVTLNGDVTVYQCLGTCNED
jgi:hypothetical protein